MRQFIDKSTLVVEIKKMKDKAYPHSDWNQGYVTSCEKILSFLDTLEVKEVDLEKEIDTYWDKYCNDEFGELFERDNEFTDDIAKHFFELGLKAQKGE